jgi:hypothetical protein
MTLQALQRPMTWQQLLLLRLLPRLYTVLHL